MAATLALVSATVFGIATACTPGSAAPAALVSVHGFRDRAGNLRVIIYRAREDEFLEPGKFVQRIDVPVPPSGNMTVCAPIPDGGDHIVVTLHDRDANGKFGAFHDGVGFGGNPRLGLGKPKIDSVKLPISGVVPLTIELNYMRGLRPRPLQRK
ncbi:MAG: DUF2141 domain-containing protein [Sandarakinorhabdus sp.]|nr:DUF2141 domain-containing protein [Sandarakinorhabdus sp.]